MPKFGAKNHNAKLPDDTVGEMRATWDEWVSSGQAGRLGAPKGYGTLGALYGCPTGTARDIARRRTRRNA